MTGAGQYVLTALEHGLLRDAETADQLEAVAKQVRARWIADALDKTADDLECPTDVGARLALDDLRFLADEYRAGRR